MRSGLPASRQEWAEYCRELGGQVNLRWSRTELIRAVRELESQLYKSYQTREEDTAVQTQASSSSQRTEIQTGSTGVQFHPSCERTEREVATRAAASSAVDYRALAKAMKLLPEERYALSRVQTRPVEDDLEENGATPELIYQNALALARELMEERDPLADQARADRECEEMAIAAVREEAAARLDTGTAENYHIQLRWNDRADALVAAHRAPRPSSSVRQGPPAVGRTAPSEDLDALD